VVTKRHTTRPSDFAAHAEGNRLPVLKKKVQHTVKKGIIQQSVEPGEAISG
jgi:hypothetical protein